MSDWEDTSCLLCGSPAIRHGFMDARGWKYDHCEGGCPPYCLKGWVHEHVRLFIKRPEDRKKIIEYLKGDAVKENESYEFLEITPDYLSRLGLLIK